MKRRTFLRASALLSALTLRPVASAAGPGTSSATAQPFNLKFGPHDGQFAASAGKNVLDQIRFAHAQGFSAWEDNGAPRRDPKEQEAMGTLLADLGMTMGVFVAFGDFRNPIFSAHKLSRDDRTADFAAVREKMETKMHETVEVAKRTGAKWVTIVPGTVDPGVLPEHGTWNTVELLKRCAAILEPAGLIAVLEPLNRMNHPGCFLQRTAQAHEICRMVDSPSVKILNDLYHQQITEGNLIQNMIDAWDEIAYIQVGDVPGRKEPGTGEVNFRHIFQWLRDRGYNGVIGMEHGKSRGGLEGEERLIASYRAVDVS